MGKLVLAIAVVAAAYFGLSQTVALRQFSGAPPSQSVPAHQTDALHSAIAEQRSGVQVTGEGTVTKLLADDSDGSRHQRFILTLASGQTLLVAHNIDLAPRLDSLRSGDSVEFNGVYEWNPKGGVIHWTHHDPGGRHQGGWLRHAGKIYR